MSIATLLQSVRVTDDMLARREFVRSLYGDGYHNATKAARGLIEAVAKGKPILETALMLCKEAVEAGHGSAISILVASALDLIEEQET